jgi:UDP-3-O-[3-hydroxymyristoyl] glucosamine N-acyltransferase
MPSYLLKEIASVVGGEVIGDGSIEIHGVAGIKEAVAGQITFLANPKYEAYLGTTRASAVIAAGNGDFAGPVIRISNPYLAFLKVVRLFAGNPREIYPRGIHHTAIVGDDVELGDDIAIGPYVVVEDGVRIGPGTTIRPFVCIAEKVTIGSDCLIYSGVSIRERCRLGDRVIVHSNAVIGSDGFGYATDGGEHHKIPQIGIVEIEDDVEIGASTTIDRATTGVTLIRRGSKLDNLVQIAHNVVIGEDSMIAAQAGVSGSTELGRNVVLAGQAGLVGHITIGDGARVGAQGGVTKSVPSGTSVSGYPAREHSFARKICAATARLPELFREFRDLQSRVEALEKGTGRGTPAEDD